jgi:hypothetical protein
MKYEQLIAMIELRLMLVKLTGNLAYYPHGLIMQAMQQRR